MLRPRSPVSLRTSSTAADVVVAGPVTSPTFILINEYAGRLADGSSLPVYHFDLYRLGGPAELDDLGCDDYFFGDGVCLVEWADLAGDVLPEETVRVRIVGLSETVRRVSVEGDGA